ncbi:MAG: MMPL family transporter [Thermomicrobiales bacterium]
MGVESPYTETVVITSETSTVDDLASQQAVADVTASLRAMPDLVNTDPTALYNYLELQAFGMQDAANRLDLRRSAHHTRSSDPAGLIDESEPVVLMIENTDIPDMSVLTIGDVSSSMTFSEVAEQDLRRGEGFGIPIALIILVIVFGALVAAGVPVILAGISILVALGATALIQQHHRTLVLHYQHDLDDRFGGRHRLRPVRGRAIPGERRRGYPKLDALERTGRPQASRCSFPV